MRLLLLPVLGIQFFLRDAGAQSVTQPDAQVTVSEEASVELKCTYSSTVTPYLFWYVQYPRQSLQLLLKYFSGDTAVQGMRGFKAEFKKTNSSFHLRKVSVHSSDSAVYYCASSNSGNQVYWGKGTSLTVTPIIKNPEPALYRLRDAKSGNNSICLLTDFESQKNVSDGKKPEWFISDPTVLDMKSMDSKSNGALAWNYQTDSDCGEAFTSVKAFFNHSDATCDAKLVEKSFETDMNLNFQNLSVMGLRILLLKVAGFNLLMTLRLWSS